MLVRPNSKSFWPILIKNLGEEKNMICKTAKEMVKAFDDGEAVTTVEMGGLGPGYEQAIQLFAIELMRKFADVEPDKLWKSISDGALGVASNECKGLGLSGAQGGAAINLVYHFIKDGPELAIQKLRESGKRSEDDFILVSKHFPSLK